MAGRLAETLKPSHLSKMLGRTGVRNKVVIISACYSGVFIPRLADANTLVITAADANHPSFGCEDKAKWTYFGDAFFNAALRRANTLKDAFLMARSLVLRRELREGFEPSHPQMAGGGNVEPLLIAHPLGVPGLRNRLHEQQSVGSRALNRLPVRPPRLLPWLVANGPVAGPSVAYLPPPRCPFLGPGIKPARRPRLDA